MGMDRETLRDFAMLRLIAVAVVGLPIVAYLASDYAELRARQKLPEWGAKVEGSILDFEIRKGRPLLSYVFTDKGKAVKIIDRPVDGLEKAERAHPITVWHDPKNPSHCITEPEIKCFDMGFRPAVLLGAAILWVTLMTLATAGVVLQRRRRSAPAPTREPQHV